tara:strand:- start:96 stop:425 length:330 start_codon:yes stop_codon:yes gene_type:complete
MAQHKTQTQTHNIGIYLWIWALLFVFSFFSYMVDYLNFEGLLRWTLILAFMVSKAALIVAVFMHLFWERCAIVNVLLWPMTLMLLFVGIMAAESEYTLFTRLLYFVAGS